MNFKVGDRVRIKSSDECENVFDWFNREEMERFCGKETTISSILEIQCINYPDGFAYQLTISEPGYGYKWNCKCFERIYNTRLMETE